MLVKRYPGLPGIKYDLPDPFCQSVEIKCDLYCGMLGNLVVLCQKPSSSDQTTVH